MSDRINSESVAEDQLRAFVERILRMREEARAIKDDIREIYAEAKGNGFDKTVLGQIVSHVEMDAADHATLMERAALFDLYLTSYQRAKGGAVPASKTGTVVATHMHETVDQETGEITESEGGRTDPGSASGEAPDTAPQLSQESQPVAPPAPTEPDRRSGDIEDGQPIGVGTVDALSGGREEASRQAHNLETAGASPVPASIPQVGGDTDKADSGIARDFGGDAATNLEPPSLVRTDPLWSGAAPRKDAGAAAPEPLTPLPGQIVMETCPKIAVRWHAFIEAFPKHDFGMRFAELVDDVRERGVQKPIVRIGGEFILDGRARYMAARQLGIAYPVVEYAGHDALADVIRWNLEARHLTAGERKSIATKLMKLPEASGRGAEIATLFGLEVEERAA